MLLPVRAIISEYPPVRIKDFEFDLFVIRYKKESYLVTMNMKILHKNRIRFDVVKFVKEIGPKRISVPTPVTTLFVGTPN